MYRSLIVYSGLAFLFLTLPGLSHAQENGFTTKAPHAVILDFETGEILYEKNARKPMAPASMTKIMTANMIFEALKNGTITMDTEFGVSEDAWRRGGAASGSSTMYLDVNSSARVEDLIRGIVVQSGNDACIVMAEGLSGSEIAFADKMTLRARELGLKSASFKNSTGWPHPDHNISAYDLARLAQYIITTHPEFYPIYSERNFTWNGIRQGNRNPLLGKFAGADGIKTGSTKASGYGLVGSAKRGDIRRIIVVNGLADKQERSDVANRLMGAAFDQFKIYNLYAKGDIIGKVDVYMGKADKVDVKIEDNIRLGLYRGDRSKLVTRLTYKPAPAPVKAGDHIADMIISAPGQAEKTVPLYAASDVKAKSIFGKAWTILLKKIRG